MLSILKGDQQGKLALFEHLTLKVQSGEAMDDSEIPIFETLKRELFRPASTIVQLEANLTGSSRTRVT